ncbi:MAG: hypothetical protein WC091_08260 [Sulfuricellaceae bacterium]
MSALKPPRSRLAIALLSSTLLVGIVFFLLKGAWWLSLALIIAEIILEGAAPALFRRKAKL